MDLFIGFFELSSLWKKTQKNDIGSHFFAKVKLPHFIQPIKSEIDIIIASWNFLFDWLLKWWFDYLSTYVYSDVYVLCSVCAALLRSLYGFGVVVVRTQCGLYATSVLRLCKFCVTSMQYFCDFSATFMCLSHKQKRTWVAEYGRKESAGSLDLQCLFC